MKILILLLALLFSANSGAQPKRANPFASSAKEAQEILDSAAVPAVAPAQPVNAQPEAAQPGAELPATGQPAPVAQAPSAANKLPLLGAPKNQAAFPKATPQLTNRPGTTAPPTLDSPLDSLLNEDLIRNLRDPFQLPSILVTLKETPKSDLEVYPLKDFKLSGVITGPKKTRAMVTTPNNKVFFVRVGDRIGVHEGRVTQIRGDSIKVTEYYVDEHSKRTPDIYELTMSGEVVSLSKKEF